MRQSVLPSAEPVFVLDPLDGKYKVKNKSTGKLELVWKHVCLEAGDEFANYVRRSGYCQEFPYNPQQSQQMLEHSNLWPRRKLRILLFAARDPDSKKQQDKGVPEIWSDACVVSWKEKSCSSGNNQSAATRQQWTLVVEFEATGLAFHAGDVVRVQGLKNHKHLNGLGGLVMDACPNKEGRYAVLITDFEKKKVRAIEVKPCNLVRVRSMEFIVHRIEIRRGGVLKVEPSSKFSPNVTFVTFHWVQDLLPTGPYWSNTSPGKKWLAPFSAEDKVDEFRLKYKNEMEACLRLDQEEEQTLALVRLKQDLKDSLTILSRNGSPIGTREARLLLLTNPLVISLVAMKELVAEAAHNIHFLDAIAWMYKSEDFDPCETETPPAEEVEAGTKLGLDCDSGDKVRSIQLSLFVDVIQALVGQKEYKKALMHAQSATGDGFLDKIIERPPTPERGNFSIACLHKVNMVFGEAWRVVWICAAAMGRVEHLNAAPLIRNDNPNPEVEYKQWIGTTGKPATVGVSWVGEKYDAEALAWTGDRRICVVCNRACVVTYWCKKCNEVPYCSASCSTIDWKQQRHWRECVPTDGKYIGSCAVCQKRSVVGCSYCKFTYYCGSECQRKHWYEGGHKEKCLKTPMTGPEP